MKLQLNYEMTKTILCLIYKLDLISLNIDYLLLSFYYYRGSIFYFVCRPPRLISMFLYSEHLDEARLLFCLRGKTYCGENTMVRNRLTYWTTCCFHRVELRLRHLALFYLFIFFPLSM